MEIKVSNLNKGFYPIGAKDNRGITAIRLRTLKTQFRARVINWLDKTKDARVARYRKEISFYIKLTFLY